VDRERPWDSDRLATFRAVARAGGFSRGARLLHRTQPAVSQAVRALEEDVGQSLFLRLGRRIELTDAGRLLLAHVEEAFGALERAREALEASRALAGGRLVLAASDTDTRYLLPPVLAAFRDRHPGVELAVHNLPSDRAAERLREGAVDLAFATLPVRHPQLRSEPLCAREDIAIVPPGHPLAARKRLRLAELLEHPLVWLDRSSRTRAFLDEQVAAAGRPARVAMELGSLEVVKRMVELGFGVSVVPRVCLDDELTRGSLVAVPVLPRALHRHFGLLQPARRPLSPAAAVLADLARSLLGPPAPPARRRV